MSKTRHELIEKRDYDRSIRLGGRTVNCYSKEAMENRFPTGAYNLAGEAVSGKAKRPQALLALFSGDENPLQVSPYKTYSRLFYESLGFVAVDETRDRYLELLRPRKSLWILSALALIAILAAVLVLLLTGKSKGPKHPDYLVPDRDPNASIMEDDDSAKADKEDGGGTVSMIYKRRVVLNLATGDLTLYFANPNHSNHDVALQLIIKRDGQDIVIAESGLLEAGYSLERLKLKEGIGMQAGGYDAYFNVDYYDSETGEKAMVKANIPVSVDAVD